jgi:hypothetical protein
MLSTKNSQPAYHIVCLSKHIYTQRAGARSNKTKCVLNMKDKILSYIRNSQPIISTTNIPQLVMKEFAFQTATMPFVLFNYAK